MRKHISLYAGIVIILLSFLGLYMFLIPRVGPIGNGPPVKLIWFCFSVEVLGGLALITQSILMFRKDKEKRRSSSTNCTE